MKTAIVPLSYLIGPTEMLPADELQVMEELNRLRVKSRAGVTSQGAEGVLLASRREVKGMWGTVRGGRFY